MRFVSAWVLAFFFGLIQCAHAEMPHADYRFASGQCWTWGGGKYKAANIWIRVFEKYDFAKSAYPVANEYRFECQYMGDADPIPSKPGEYVAKIGANCYAKTVLVEGMPKTSYPILTGGYGCEYNEGWCSVQAWCKWDPWAYGAPTVTTSTTSSTLVP